MSISEYSLNWDSFKTNICDGFTNLQQQGDFVDMTLAADGHYVKVHRSLIALASPYLKDIIKSIPCQHPVVFLNNIGYDELCYALEYIYTGEVQIPTNKIKNFLKIATSLHIKGIQDTLSCEINTLDTSRSTIQPTPVTQEKTICMDQIPVLTTKLVASQKARPRGRPYKIRPPSDSVARKSCRLAEKEIITSNTENNEVQPTNESVDASPGLSEFLTINRAEYDATQKDDSVSLSDFFLTDDKDKEPQQENNVQSFITHPYPISTKGKGIDSNVDMESAQPISLDAMSTDFFSKDLTSESNVTKQLFPGKIIDYDNGKGKSMFQIEVLSQEELVNGIRTKTDIYNEHINTDAFDDIDMELQEETPRENIDPCPTLENFEDIIDQQQNLKTTQPTAQYNITLTGGCEGISVQNVNTNDTPAITTAVDAETNNLEELTDADIKGSCCPQYTVSNQGSMQLIMNRFIYYLHNKSKKDQSRRRWRCVDYRQKGCKAFIDTDGESILNRAGLHVHPFHDKRILKKSLQNKVFSTIAATKADVQKMQNGSQSVVHFNDSEDDES